MMGAMNEFLLVVHRMHRK